MSDRPPGPQERRPIPSLVWTGLAIVLVVVFAMLMWAMNPPAGGVGKTAPQVIMPAQAKP